MTLSMSNMTVKAATAAVARILFSTVLLVALLVRGFDVQIPPKKVVVIGGGWAGFSAADALSSATTTTTTSAPSSAAFEVTLLDASPRGPGGLAAGWTSPKLNKTVEAGIHGFWRDYANVFATMKRIGLDLDQTLTPFTPSLLVSQSGKVALSPVLGDSDDDGNNNNVTSSTNFVSSLVDRLSELLPPPLDLALLSEFNADAPLTILDRLSGVGLLGAWADFEQEDRASWERYDKISADNLFRSVAAVSPALYDDLVSPLLHVLPMTPGYDCSAAAALSCFHVFALQSKGAFDVRWCRGSITEKIFNPWTKKLQERDNVQFCGGSKVTSIEEMTHERTTSGTRSSSSHRFRLTLNDGDETIDCDAIMLAVGGTALKRLLPSCPSLARLPDATGWKNFRGVTCVAVRLFLAPSATRTSLLQEGMKDSPVVVCGPKIGGIPSLVETGFCIYDLERLQGESGAIEVDFFRADALADLSDDVVVQITLEAIAAALQAPSIYQGLVLDMSVVRAREAVSHFCVNSTQWSPDVKLGRGLYICGDWIDRTGHASWSTEKAVVTGIQAAAAAADDFGAQHDVTVIPAPSDTAQLQALRDLARSVRNVVPFDILPKAPWASIVRRLLEK